MNGSKKSLLQKIDFVLAFLPLLVTIVLLPFLPDSVPAHYGIDGHVNRWGSKYETLILPLLLIALTFLIQLFDRAMLKKDQTRTESQKTSIQKVTDISLLCLEIVFNILCFIILYANYFRVSNLSTVPLGFYKILVMILSIMDIVLGNILPKCRKNSTVGIRIKWTLKSEEVWNKTHRFCGKLFIAFGLAIFAACIISPESPVLLYIYLGSVVVEMAIACIYAHRTYINLEKSK